MANSEAAWGSSAISGDETRFLAPRAVAAVVSIAARVPPPIEDPRANESVRRSATSVPVNSPPWAAVPAITAASWAVSVNPSPTAALPTRFVKACAASPKPCLVSSSATSPPVIVASLSTGITLPAPNRSKKPTKAPIDAAIFGSYEPVFSSVSKADSPVAITIVPPVTAAPAPNVSHAGAPKMAPTATAPPPAIAAPPVGAVSSNFSPNAGRNVPWL